MAAGIHIKAIALEVWIGSVLLMNMLHLSSSFQEEGINGDTAFSGRSMLNLCCVQYNRPLLPSLDTELSAVCSGFERIVWLIIIQHVSFLNA